MTKHTTAATAAFLFTFLTPAFGQAQEQKIYRIENVAKKYDIAPASITAVHEDLRWRAERRTSTAVQVNGPTCHDFLIARPAIAGTETSDANIDLLVGCTIPAGSWIVNQFQYGDGMITGASWQTIQDIFQGQVIRWITESALTRGGGKFFLIIAPPGTTARQIETSFDAPIPLQTAFERITPTPTKPQRTVVVQGIIEGGFHALFGNFDITNRVVFEPTNTLLFTLTFDVNDLNIREGTFVPLTIAQGNENQTVLIFHPNCETGLCSLTTPPPPPPLPSITVTKNSAVGDQTYPAGATNARIGSYSISAPTTTSVVNLTLLANVQFLQNLHIVTSVGTQYGLTQPTVNPGTAATYSGQITIPAGNTINFDVLADIISGSSGTFNPATSLKTITAIDVNSGAAIPTPIGVLGQGLTITNTAPTISITPDGSSPSGDVTMGSTGNILGIFRLQNQGAEEVGITDLTILDNTEATRASFSNLQLTLNGFPLATAGFVGPAKGGGYAYQIHLPAPLRVSAGTFAVVTLRGDAPSFASGGEQDNSVHLFQISAGQGIGTASGLAAAISGSGFGGSIRILRTNLVVSTFSSGGSQHIPNFADTIGAITFSANQAGPVALNKVTISFAGTSNFVVSSSNVSLIDPNGVNLANTGQTGTAVDAINRTVTWLFPGNSYIITAGASVTFTLRVNSTALAGGTLSAVIANPTDLLFADGLDPSATQGLTLPPSNFPLVINAVNYRP